MRRSITALPLLTRNAHGNAAPAPFALPIPAQRVLPEALSWDPIPWEKLWRDANAVFG